MRACCFVVRAFGPLRSQAISPLTVFAIVSANVSCALNSAARFSRKSL
jgi:hypothetical protein